MPQSRGSADARQELHDGVVERVRVLPQARVTTTHRRPLRSWYLLLKRARQADRDQDVLLAGEHQRGNADRADAVGRVMLLDRLQLREVGLERLVHRGHLGLEL